MNLEGFDPFIDGDIDYLGRVRVQRKALDEVSGAYDLIMMHHSLEHIPDQRGSMATLRTIVRPGGYLMIRVPLSLSWAAHVYGPHWFQLDAPRHCVLHTPASLTRLCADFGFELLSTVFDSTEEGFTESERYRRRAGLGSAEDDPVDPMRIRTLNKSALGDQAAFLFRRLD